MPLIHRRLRYAGVARRVRAWIETLRAWIARLTASSSPAACGRGLKPVRAWTSKSPMPVARRVRAWIET